MLILQVTIGRRLSQEKVDYMDKLFKQYSKAIFSTPYPGWENEEGSVMWNSLRAREGLLKVFQEEVDVSRAAIEEIGAAAADGILGNLVLAVDEDGNR